jgi:hypothetical protein
MTCPSKKNASATAIKKNKKDMKNRTCDIFSKPESYDRPF